MKNVYDYFESHIKLGHGNKDSKSYMELGDGIYSHNKMENCDSVTFCQNGIFITKNKSEYRLLYSDFSGISGLLTLPEFSKKSLSEAIEVTFHMKDGRKVVVNTDKRLYSTFIDFFNHYVGLSL